MILYWALFSMIWGVVCFVVGWSMATGRLPWRQQARRRH